MKKAKIIYCRCSTSNRRKKVDADGNISLHQQDPMLQPPMIYNAFPESVDAEVLVEYGASAFKNDGNIKNRPVFESILKRIELGEVDSLYLFDLDRAYRNRRKSLELVELCIKHNCKIQSVNQKWLNEISDIKPKAVAEMMTSIILNVISYLSEEDSRNKSEKIKSAVRIEDGVTRSARGNKWGVPSQIGSEMIKKMRELRKSGLTFREISKQTNHSLASVHEKCKDI